MYRLVHTSIWREDWFRALSPEAKLIFLYLLTCDYTQPTGFAPLSPQSIADETGLSLTNVEVNIPTLNDKVFFFPAWGFWMKRFSQWQGKGKNWVKALSTNLSKLPPIIKIKFLQEYPDTPSEGGSLAPSEGVYQKSENNSNQESVISNQESVLPPTPSTPFQGTKTTTTTTLDNGFALMIKAYENEIGMLTPAIGDQLKALFGDHPSDMTGESWADWIVKAIQYAARRNARNLAYVEATLKGWQAQGFKTIGDKSGKIRQGITKSDSSGTVENHTAASIRAGLKYEAEKRADAARKAGG